MRTSSQAQEARQAASSPSATKGAVYLILTQVVSRGFTFLANQVLLRQVSPGVFGAAAQLELFSISILFFSRESVRVSLQRRPPIAPAWEKAEDDDNGTSNDRRKSSTRGRRGVLQEAVNIAWLPVILGTILVLLLGVSYNHVMRHVSSITPYFTLSLKIVGFGCMIELLAEPCFAIVQARGGFKTRAKVESAAAISKCAGACSTAVVAAKAGMVDDPGVLPFAAGLFAYSTTILVGYLVHTIPLRKKESFSLFPLPIFDTAEDSRSEYLLNRFSQPLISLAANIYGQSVVKHILTQGDNMALAATSSLEEQGFYALVSNYGGLVARLFFQPIDESSRYHFGKVLTKQDRSTKAENDDSAIAHVKNYLCNILRCYLLVTLLVVSLAPALAPGSFQLLVGSRWSSSISSSEIHALLSVYCYYIPFLAINGIMEALVASTATPSQLQQQSAWMGLCSLAFFGTSYGCLVVGNLGATGIVWANIVNMVLRIAFAVVFAVDYFRRHGRPLSPSDALPNLAAAVKACAAFAVMALLDSQQPKAGLETSFLMKKLILAVFLAMFILYGERDYLIRIYRQCRSF